MNELQLHLYHVITSIMETDGLDGYFLDQNALGKKRIIEHSAIRYGILNYVAKYSLANDTYFITSRCYEHIQSLGLIKNGKLLRGSKGSKHKFTFEHAVPSNVIADNIIINIHSKAKVKKILQDTDLVTAITYEENAMINKSGYNQIMPGDSFNTGDMFARYKLSGVEVPTKKISVYGRIAR